MPVKVGLAKFAFKSKALCCAVETGLFASDVLSAFPNPTIAFVTPLTVPVKVGPAKGAFKSNCACKFVVSPLTIAIVKPVTSVPLTLLKLTLPGVPSIVSTLKLGFIISPKTLNLSSPSNSRP